MLRVTIADTTRSILDNSEGKLPFADHISALNTISNCIARLVNIIQTRALVFGDPDQREQESNAILALMDRVGQVEAPPSGDGSSGERKHPGAPRGNMNAFRHGFYARLFTPDEKARLLVNGLEELLNEESLLRVLILHAWRAMREPVSGSITYQEHLFGCRSIANAVFVIEKLQKMRHRINGDQTDLEKDILLGLEQARTDLGILDCPSASGKK